MEAFDERCCARLVIGPECTPYLLLKESWDRLHPLLVLTTLAICHTKISPWNSYNACQNPSLAWFMNCGKCLAQMWLLSVLSCPCADWHAVTDIQTRLQHLGSAGLKGICSVQTLVLFLDITCFYQFLRMAAWEIYLLHCMMMLSFSSRQKPQVFSSALNNGNEIAPFVVLIVCSLVLKTHITLKADCCCSMFWLTWAKLLPRD